MSHICTHLTPFGRYVTVTELNEVEGILHKDIMETLTVGLGFKRRDIRMTHKLTGNAIVEYW